MAVNIKTSVEGRIKTGKSLKTELDYLSTLKRNLEKDPTVLEYLKVTDELVEAKDLLEIKMSEFDQSLQSECNHPLWVLLYPFVVKEKDMDHPCECAVCRKVRDITVGNLDILYQKKKIIMSKDYSPLAMVSEVRDIYLKAYNVCEGEEDIPTSEEITFEYFQKTHRLH